MPDFPNAPQGFTFGTLQLYGTLVGFNGGNKRLSVDHRFLKRTGARVEDFARDQRRLTVRLAFIGPNCAAQYNQFESAVDENPRGLLVHPFAGRWFAFCEGPDYSVDFNQTLNAIYCNVMFKEDQLDAAVTAPDTPDVATAAQNVTGAQSQYQQTVAAFMGTIARAQVAVGSAQAQVDSLTDQLATVTAPVDFMRSSLAALTGVTSQVYGAISGIAVASDLLAQDITAFGSFAQSLFAGSDFASGFSDPVQTQLGIVQTSGQALEDNMTAATPTPAACADAVQDTETAVASCIVLADALQLALPPVIGYTVPKKINLLALAQLLIFQRGLDRKADEYANAILANNRIPNPANIPAGTVLLIPSQ